MNARRSRPPNQPVISRRKERGAVMVLTALLLVAMMAMAALVVDLGALRVSSARAQTDVDLAATAAAEALAVGNYVGACRAAMTTLVANDPSLAALEPDAFCSAGAALTSTSCSVAGGTPQTQLSSATGDRTVTLRFPVSDTEISDGRGTAGINDGAPCQRMRIVVQRSMPAIFGGVLGARTHSTTRSATVRAGSDPRTRIPALWLLDPTGCTALSVSGGSQLTVGSSSSSVLGVIRVDSDASACQSNQVTISSSGSGTSLSAWPSTGTPTGQIALRALPPGATSCSAPACNPADVSGGRLLPQPIGSLRRATRAPADHRFNCRDSYPDYHGIPIPACTEGSPAFVDRLVAAIGTSGNPSPSTFNRFSTTFGCDPTGTVVADGNWWVDCPKGLRIGNGTSVTFTGGNLVMDGGLSMTGGSLTVNSSNPAASLPVECRTPLVETPCLGPSSAGAAFVFSRSGDWDITGGAIRLERTMLYQRSGYVKVASATPVWTAPVEGPFALLALWSELSSSKYTINGGGGVTLSGIFFTPEAKPMSLSGGGDWGQQRAQFITHQLAVSGGGVLTMAPDPNMLQVPPEASALIR